MARTNMPKSPQGRAAAWVAIVASLVTIAAAQRDLHRRSDSEINGDRRIWRVVCLNALGAFAYFRFGRRD